MTQFGGVRKTCEQCGRSFVAAQPQFRLCSDCQRTAQSSRPGAGPGRGPAPVARPRAGLPAGYLAKGYFSDKNVPLDEVLVDWPLAIARSLGPEMKTAQLRRFYTRVKAIESGLDAGDEFSIARAGLMELPGLAAYAVGRGTAPEMFKEFIEKNVELATRDAQSFAKGFILHFQSLMAYFKYLNPKE